MTAAEYEKLAMLADDEDESVSAFEHQINSRYCLGVNKMQIYPTQEIIDDKKYHSNPDRGDAAGRCS